jgi:Bacterial toxin of type II toxin-antitoxin system, YafQ
VRTFSRTTQFKKDVKLAGKRGKDLPKLKAALERLIEGAPLPAEFKDHPLRGNFAGRPPHSFSKLNCPASGPECLLATARRAFSRKPLRSFCRRLTIHHSPFIV